MPIVLSHYQVAPLLAAFQAGERAATTSPDLGLSQVEVTLSPEGVIFPSGERLPWPDAERIRETENQCFVVEGDAIRSIQVYSEMTHWLRSLFPTAGAPTMLVAGFPMHRIKGIDPWEDTRHKVAAGAPITGDVLDTTTGLGYTAIQAAATARSVTTIELDPASLEVARLNPWSRDLFTNPVIRQIIGDAVEVLPDLPAASFDRILHDPPTFSLAGELYSLAFYRELFRLLRGRGKLFHYIGDPTSALGKRTTAGVIRRLNEAGFRRVDRRPEAFGVLAQK